MPGQKKRYNVRFPPGRIKKIMQKDADVGRIAAAVPVLLSRALEMFVKSLLTKTCLITEAKLSTVVLLSHMKQCIESEKLFHFLNELVDRATSLATQRDARALSMWSLYRTKRQTISVKKQMNVEELTSRPNQRIPETNDEGSSDTDSPLYICL